MVRYELGTAELEVLRALWALGPATVRQVMERLHEQGRGSAYTTVQTLLTRLAQKGYVEAIDRNGLAFVYRARLTRRQLSRSRLRALVDQLYDGAAGSLVLELVRSAALKPEEIAELSRLIERLETQPRQE